MIEYAAVVIIVTIVIAQYRVTDRFLAEVERDNPDKYKEIWPQSESLLAILLPFRFGLLYVVSGTYEYWNLGPDGLRWAWRVKVSTWLVVVALLIISSLVVASLL